MLTKTSRALIRINAALCDEVDALTFSPPVMYVYNPLRYAWKMHEKYLEKFASGPKKIVFLGMNPGPFGMGQTGIPFGDVAMVRDWMKISAPIHPPARQHPKRLVQGFDCPRSEVSGSRVWGWARDRFGDAESFFEEYFVINYCPLFFVEESSRNRTPDKLIKSESAPLLAACDDAFGKMVDVLQPELVVGVGVWAEKRAKIALDGRDIRIGSILHPSPASPKANRGWAAAAEQDLLALGVQW